MKKEKFDKYISIIKKVFGKDYDKYWSMLLIIFGLEQFENKNEEEIENMLLDLKESCWNNEK